jgi:hypothetical protein
MTRRSTRNIAGQRFGRLVAVEESGNLYKCKAWLCRCDCGCLTRHREFDLLANRIKSCGCLQTSRIRDLRNKRFGRVLVIDIGPGRGVERHWKCRCDCGREWSVGHGQLLRGKIRSCGCITKERLTTHGMTDSKEYMAYMGARGRCVNANDSGYPDYGGRGIEFRFDTFEDFFSHVGPRPAGDFSLDRIDPDGHYERGNVRWAPRTVQQTNKRPRIRHRNGISLDGLAPEDQQAVRELVESLRQKERAA